MYEHNFYKKDHFYMHVCTKAIKNIFEKKTNNNVYFNVYIPLCPSRVWFMDKLLGAAKPFAFTSLPAIQTFDNNRIRDFLFK